VTSNERLPICGLFSYDHAQVTETTEIHFDGWTLRPSSGELLHDGNVQRLPQQPLRVLVELLEHPGEVVTRQRLVALLWPKGVVDFDNSLNAVVRKIRVALEDDSETPRYIQTLPRIGYRFIGTVALAAHPAPEVRAPNSTSERIWLRWSIPVVAGVVLLAASIAWWQADPASPPSDEPTTLRTDAVRRSTSQRAYELYLNGKFHRSRRDVNGNPLAIENFRVALREDPYFAEAWAAMSETYVGMGTQQQMPLTAAMEQARSTALRAIELNPKLAAGHTALGLVILYYDSDYPAAEKEFLKARAADERYARLWHGFAVLRGFQGRTDEAFDYVGRARELEPMTLLYGANYANLLYYTRRYEEAIEYVRSLLASQPRFDQVRGVLIRSLVETGDIKGALAQLSLRYSEVPILSDDGLAYARGNRREDAVRQLERLRRHGRDGYAVYYEMAIIYAALGQTDEACAALRRARDDHSPTLGWLRLDPRMDPLRAHSCYSELVRGLYKD
jgi:DNA-binding winged helix-turn-helix (wHTH) protein/tetratricopeptide (TPR) repeat protein